MEAIIQSKINELAQCITDGINSWVRAGELVVEILSDNPDAVDDICCAVPGLPKDVIYRFEAIGRREVHPQLLLSTAPGIKKLAAMPYSVQCKFVSDPIPVMVDTEHGTDTLLVSVQNMTSDQCHQVFGSVSVRGLPEQRAWNESEKRKAIASKIDADPVPYSVSGSKVTFRKGCIVTKREMKQIISIM